MHSTVQPALANTAVPPSGPPPRKKPRRRPRFSWRQLALGLIVPILFVLLWFLGRSFEWQLPFGIRMAFLPFPGDVFVSLVDFAFGGIHNDAFSGTLWLDLGASALRVLAGFLLAATLAIPLGILMGRFTLMTSLFDPFINLFRPIPATAWVPLVGLLIGWGDQATIFLITLSAFFPIVLGAISGAREVPQRLIEASQMLGSRPWETLYRVVVPASAPAVVNGLRVGLGLAWVVLVLGESVGVSTGLGSTIILARDVVRTDVIVVSMICIGLAGFLSDRLLIGTFKVLFRGRPLIK